MFLRHGFKLITNITSKVIRRHSGLPVGYWDHVHPSKESEIMKLNQLFQSDINKNKINLCIGAYRDEQGKPLVLKSVKKAKEEIGLSEYNHEYPGILGHQPFIESGLKLAYGDYIISDFIAATQTVSGTGALRIGFDFIKKNTPGSLFDDPDGNDDPPTIHVPDVTWENHRPIAEKAGLIVKEYPYYFRHKQSVLFDQMCKYLTQLPKKHVILLHTCGHNPTGFDLDKEQWDKLIPIFIERQHLAFFDCAYLGFVSGSIETDAYPIREFLKNKIQTILAQSFSKNFGLYGERVGLLSIPGCDNRKLAIESKFKEIIRPMYSNPPLYGARIVTHILNNHKLKLEWKSECTEMADRIKKIRSELLNRLGPDWEYLSKQQGMFAFSKLTRWQIEQLRTTFHIYMTSNGRISLSGINMNNIDYLCIAIKNVSN